jgi:hypothetical protein
MWDVGCGMWDVGCGMWDVGCGMWAVGWGLGLVLLVPDANLIWVWEDGMWEDGMWERGMSERGIEEGEGGWGGASDEHCVTSPFMACTRRVYKRTLYVQPDGVQRENVYTVMYPNIMHSESRSLMYTGPHEYAGTLPPRDSH